jgi:ribosomal subunit interface protein
MIARMELKGVHLTIDDKLRKYIERKLGTLDRLMSRHSRESAHLEVTLRESTGKGAKRCHCDLTLHLPHGNIIIKEATVNMYAAVDIAEAKLKLQLKKYKDTHEQGKLRRKLFNRRSQPAALTPDTDLL